MNFRRRDTRSLVAGASLLVAGISRFALGLCLVCGLYFAAPPLCVCLCVCTHRTVTSVKQALDTAFMSAPLKAQLRDQLTVLNKKVLEAAKAAAAANKVCDTTHTHTYTHTHIHEYTQTDTHAQYAHYARALQGQGCIAGIALPS